MRVKYDKNMVRGYQVVAKRHFLPPDAEMSSRVTPPPLSVSCACNSAFCAQINSSLNGCGSHILPSVTLLHLGIVNEFAMLSTSVTFMSARSSRCFSANLAGMSA